MWFVPASLGLVHPDHLDGQKKKLIYSGHFILTKEEEFVYDFREEKEEPAVLKQKNLG